MSPVNTTLLEIIFTELFLCFLWQLIGYGYAALGKKTVLLHRDFIEAHAAIFNGGQANGVGASF